MIILFFINPFVFLILGIVFCRIIKSKIPEAPNIRINIGRLNKSDLKLLNESQKTSLYNQIFSAFLLAVVITAAIGILYILMGYANDAAMIGLCVFVQLAAGLASLVPVFRMSADIKAELLKR